MRRLFGYIQSVIILGFLSFVIYYFYTWEDEKSVAPIFGVIFLSLLTDGLFILIHLPRKQVVHERTSFDPKKLTIIIACYNGESIIGETIKQARLHVPAKQILVVSDASTDNTAKVARSYGVRVHQNKENLNKAFSISAVMHKIKTPYVLILDDDTLIKDTFIPTSLLDEGYSAVAFNVMPVETGTLVNKLQIYEYRKSMVMGKGLRAGAGAVGNISGAIGLYRTNDLLGQVPLHSGQFGGEDQQRTSLVHLKSEGGKGVTYTSETVLTMAPDTWKSFLKQRSFRWNLSLPELFVIYMKVLFTHRFHFLLKTEKAYQMYLLLTDPLRILFFWAIFLHPFQAGILYLIYSFLTFLVWLKIGKKDPWWIILIYPMFSLVESVCRFIAHFYWFKIKYHYLFEKKHHKRVSERKLAWEYSMVMVLLVFIWTLSANSLQRTARYIYQPEGYYEQVDEVAHDPQVLGLSLSKQETPPTLPAVYYVKVDQGDGKSMIARKAISLFLEVSGQSLTPDQLIYAEDSLSTDIQEVGVYKPDSFIQVNASDINDHIQWVLENYHQ